MSFFTIVFLPGLNFDSGPEVCEDSFFEMGSVSPLRRFLAEATCRGFCRLILSCSCRTRGSIKMWKLLPMKIVWNALTAFFLHPCLAPSFGQNGDVWLKYRFLPRHDLPKDAIQPASPLPPPRLGCKEISGTASPPALRNFPPFL